MQALLNVLCCDKGIKKKAQFFDSMSPRDF